MGSTSSLETKGSGADKPLVGGNRGLNGVVTRGLKQRWVLGAQALVYAQDVIIMQGPSVFVKRCLDSNMPNPHEGKVAKYILAFIFLLVIPMATPALYSHAIMSYTWDFHKVGAQRIAWSQDRAAFQIYQDNDDFTARNVKFDLVKLRTLLNDTKQDRGVDVIYLDNQTFQSRMYFWYSQIICGIWTLIISSILFCLRVKCEKQWWMKKFVINILHGDWTNNSYPRLQYSTRSLFGARVMLYKSVPCVWLAMWMSFIFVVPGQVAYYDVGETTHKFRAAFRVMPSCLLAAYAVGSLYFQLANALFVLWLSTGVEFAIIERQFEVEMHEVYAKLLKHQNHFVVTDQEIEELAGMKSVEMWLRWESLQRSPEMKGESQKLAEIREDMLKGAWEHAQNELHEVMKKNGVTYKDYKRMRTEALRNCVTSNVYVVDTKADISFWIDVTKGTCINNKDRSDTFDSVNFTSMNSMQA